MEAILVGMWCQPSGTPLDESGYSRTSFFIEHYQLQLWSNFTYFELRPTTGDQFEQEEHRNLEGGDMVERLESSRCMAFHRPQR